MITDSSKVAYMRIRICVCDSLLCRWGCAFAYFWWHFICVSDTFPKIYVDHYFRHLSRDEELVRSRGFGENKLSRECAWMKSRLCNFLFETFNLTVMHFFYARKCNGYSRCIWWSAGQNKKSCAFTPLFFFFNPFLLFAIFIFSSGRLCRLIAVKVIWNFVLKTCSLSQMLPGWLRCILFLQNFAAA